MGNSALSSIGVMSRPQPRRRTAPQPKFTSQYTKARPDMVKNASGAYVFNIDDMARLERFLITGTEGGATQVASEIELTLQNAQTVERLVRNGYGVDVVDKVVAISDAGRAPKNDYAIFVLAMVAGIGDNASRKYALQHLNKVARTGGHLLMFVQYVRNFRGWGRGLRTAIANWYTSKPASELLYQATKYKSRNGYSHGDLLRLSHPLSGSAERDWAFEYIIRGNPEAAEVLNNSGVTRLPWAIEHSKTFEGDAYDKAAFVRETKLAREHIPTEWLKESEVWEALLDFMPLTAIIRNLGTMTMHGVLTERSAATRTVCQRLTDVEYIKKSRVHPITIFIAMLTYKSGQGLRGSNYWTPVHAILSALDNAYYLAFGNVEATGQSILLGVDTSGSMKSQKVANVPNLSARQAAAAMASVTLNVEKNSDIVFFSDKLEVPRQSLRNLSLEQFDEIVRKCHQGGTDCSLPIQYALQTRKFYDVIVVYTDNETNGAGWGARVHPYQAMQEYRRQVNPRAKLIVVGTTATSASIAPQDDPYALDVVGFDAALPQIISAFAQI